MDTSIFPNILYVLKIAWLVFSHGGFVFFVILGIYLLYQMYMDEIQGQYESTIEWVFLEIKPPKENPTSFYSAEQVLMQLHILLDNFTFQEKYLEGKTVFKLSMEIVSLGGYISYVFRIPAKQRDLVEAALYASYPTLEITEVKDYLANFTYDPDDTSYDIFAAEFVLLKSQSIPIRTYREFEGLTGPEVSNVLVDPLSPLFEAFKTISANEIYSLQTIIQPVNDADWEAEAKEQIEKLSAGKEYMALDDITKQRITAIKAKMGRPAFATKIRLLHMGLKSSFNKNAKKLVLSPFKIFGSANFNGFKPGFSPKKDYRISPTLEAPYINWWVRRRKIELFNAFKGRSMWVGLPKFILNTEELATIFHFPITTPSQLSNVESLEMKKIQPPSNLPIG